MYIHTQVDLDADGKINYFEFVNSLDQRMLTPKPKPLTAKPPTHDGQHKHANGNAAHVAVSGVNAEANNSTAANGRSSDTANAKRLKTADHDQHVVHEDGQIQGTGQILGTGQNSGRGSRRPSGRNTPIAVSIVFCFFFGFFVLFFLFFCFFCFFVFLF